MYIYTRSKQQWSYFLRAVSSPRLNGPPIDCDGAASSSPHSLYYNTLYTILVCTRVRNSGDVSSFPRDSKRKSRDGRAEQKTRFAIYVLLMNRELRKALRSSLYIFSCPFFCRRGFINLCFGDDDLNGSTLVVFCIIYI